MKKHFFFIVIFILLAFSTGCDKDKKNYIIPKDDFEEILVDIHLMDGLTRQHNIRNKLARENDSLNYYDAILKSHDYTRAQFDSSMVYYSKNINKFDDIYENVLSELNRMEAEAEDEIEKQRKMRREQKDKDKKEQAKRLGNPYKIELGSKVQIKR
jgi:septal ring factor EnvC (AmiA/AmiB activator)